MSDRLAVVVCVGPTCGDKRGSGALYKRLKKITGTAGLADRIYLGRETCFGECNRGPNILVCPVDDANPDAGAVLGLGRPGALVYTRVMPEDLERIIAEHLVGGTVVTAFLNRPAVKDD